MSRTISADGTSIAFDRVGQGPALIIVGGGPTDRSANNQLVELLAPNFTVFNYDRRGHGGSGDTRPYAVSREYEDLEALIHEAGQAVHMYGTSGGGMIALEAAARGLAINRLAVWEPPYIVDDSRAPVPADYQQQLVDLLAENRRGDMVELFFTTAVGMPAEHVTPMRQMPFWKDTEAVAHTLVYDAMITGDFSLPAERIANVPVPTLVVDGGTTPWLTAAAGALADVVPNVRRATLSGQPHNVDAAAIAPTLAEFLVD
ncbi:alpha/beta hydrolase [Micromonospora lupini]|uniref:alpha/beta fold hydrolase n=1 Tax=Micromonospora lupini TaxID=285679 RepID=UPI00225866CD|nr:alpha/beta hydrolase [Micromonospora lupini]MCX5065992.1 alpha/beta hydrolase [Micromonospora lupini]